MNNVYYLTRMPLQASVLLRSEQAATLDFSKCHFVVVEVALREIWVISSFVQIRRRLRMTLRLLILPSESRAFAYHVADM